jgi:uncharacterized protein YbjT (DUF2867 family)
MSNNTPKSKIKTLVIGSMGKTGRRVIEKLTAMGWPVQGGSRSSNPKFDWNDSATWKPALTGIKAVYITFQPDVAMPGAVPIIQQFTDTAVAQGVEQIVLLSGRGEVEAQLCEEIVMRSGINWTIVRASWFNQNFSEGNFFEAVQAGHVALPVGDVGEPFIDADDIADVVVAALTEEGHNRKIYEVTGPRLLTFKQAVEEISRATGRTITFEKVSMDDYAVSLSEFGLPPEIISLISYLLTEVLDGRNESITDGVEKALGRKPKDFSEFAREAAAAGIWK